MAEFSSWMDTSLRDGVENLDQWCPSRLHVSHYMTVVSRSGFGIAEEKPQDPIQQH
jgi:hypothetical protein